MACRRLEQKQVEEERVRLEQQPRYVPGDKGRGAVHFQFNLDPSEVGESLFVIFSARARRAVYRGPYGTSITVEMDDVLSSDGHYDGLEFWLLQLTQRQLCIWINERGEPYWRPGAHVTIGLLDEQTVDEGGLPKRFDVVIL